MRTKMLAAVLVGAVVLASGAGTASAQGDWENFTNSNNPVAIAVGRGTVWVGTTGGLVEWDAASGTFVRHLPPEGFPDNSVAAVAVDADGRPWIGLGTWNGGLAVLDGGRWTVWRSVDGLPTNWVTSMAIDGTGRKWIGTVRGLAVLDDGGTPSDKLDDVWVSFKTEDGLVQQNVNAIAIDDAGRAWCATNGGLSVLDPQGTPFDKTDDVWTTFTTTDGLLGDSTLGVTMDGAGNVWIGNRTGLSVLDPRGTPADKSDDAWTSFASAEGFSKGYMYDVAFDGEGRAWIGWRGGVAVLEGAGTPFDRSDDRVTQFTMSDGLLGNTVGALALDESGAVWSACMSRGVNRLDPHGTPADKSDDVWGAYVTNDWLPSPEVTAVRVEPDVTWIGTSGGLVAYREDARTTFDLGSATALERDAAGVLWIATSAGLAALSDGGTPFDQSDDILTKYSKADGLVASAVRGLAINAAGRVWCATGNGVSVLDPAGTPHDKTDDRWATFTAADGMAGDWANAIAVEGDRLVWIVHESASVSVLDHGGTPFDKSDDVWALFGETSPIGIGSGYSVVIDDAGTKWFGLCPGLFAFDDGGTLLDTADDRWLRFDVGDCDPGIAIDELGRKWVATGWTGVTMLDDGETPFDASDDVLTNFTIAGGLIDNRTNTIAVGGGYVWIGTDGGLSRFKP